MYSSSYYPLIRMERRIWKALQLDQDWLQCQDKFSMLWLRRLSLHQVLFEFEYLRICLILSSSTILSMELAQILSHISIGKFDFLGPMIKIDRKYT